MGTDQLRDLSDFERSVFDRCAAGEALDFRAAAEKPRIPGELIRRIALSSPPRGVLIAGAHVDGAIALSDSDLGALALEDCDLDGVVDVSGSRTGRVSIRNSRFTKLHARGTQIAGGLDFAGAGALTEEAWIDAGSSTIFGGVDGCDAKLRAPAARDPKDVLPWAHNYALRLSECRIHGSILLNGSFVADGGFSMDDAFVHGSVKARGATFIAGEGDTFHPGDSFRAHTAKIDGHCEFGFGFRTFGRLWLLGAKIGDRLSIGMVSSELRRPREMWDWAGRNINSSAALMADQIQVGGAFLIITTKIDGTVSLNDARIGATARIVESTIANRSADGQSIALTAERAHFENGLILGPKARFEGRTMIDGAQIGGHLDLRGSEFDNGEAADGAAFSADWAKIDHAILGVGDAAGAGEVRFSGRVSLANARSGR